MKNMKTFVTYLKESLGTKLTIEWMKEHYEKYNKELFNNELPSNIDLGFIKNGEDALGIQGYNKEFIIWKDKIKNGMYQCFIVKPGKSKLVKFNMKGNEWIAWDDNDRYQEVTNCEQLDPFIKMNPKYDFSDFQKEDTMIHEMIHLWVSKDGLEPKRSHGKEFKAKCNEVRVLAKKLYNIEYDLGTRAKRHTDDPEKDYQISDEWKQEIKSDIENAAKKGGGVYGVLVYFDKNKMPKETAKQIEMLKYTKRFVFCTRSMLPKILRHVKIYKGITKILIASPVAYMKYYEKYGKFRTVNSFAGFWNVNDYDEQIFIDNTVKEERFDESLNEGLLDWFKKVKDKIMSVFVKIKKGTPLSAINLEDYVEDIEKIEDEEQEGCEATDKKMIEEK